MGLAVRKASLCPYHHVADGDRARSHILSTGRLACDPVSRVSSTVLLRLGVAPALPSAGVGKGEGRLNSFICCRWQGRTGVGASFPHPHHHVADDRSGTWFPILMPSRTACMHTPVDRVSSILLSRQGVGPALEGVSAGVTVNEGQGQLCAVLAS